MGPRVSSAALAERLESVIGPRATIARGVLDPDGLMNAGKIFAGARP